MEKGVEENEALANLERELLADLGNADRASEENIHTLTQPAIQSTIQPTTALPEQVENIDSDGMQLQVVAGPSSGVIDGCPPRHVNRYDSETSELLTDTRIRTRSVASNVSSTTEALPKHRVQCTQCQNSYTTHYFKKHKCNPKK